MLLPKNMHPLDSIYFNGAIVLEKLQVTQGDLDMIQLYKIVNSEKAMTFPVFILCLDWLFLMNLAEVDEKGAVHLCL